MTPDTIVVAVLLATPFLVNAVYCVRLALPGRTVRYGVAR